MADSLPVKIIIICTDLLLRASPVTSSALLSLKASLILRFNRLRSTARLNFLFGTETASRTGEPASAAVFRTTAFRGYALIDFPSVTTRSMSFRCLSLCLLGNVNRCFTGGKGNENGRVRT
ncbi:MAG TPA: hypothetical protein VFW78_14055 [Bacteroidia bacterium]|nr:hypothetical protein [Bacteroidia bacterium]